VRNHTHRIDPSAPPHGHEIEIDADYIGAFLFDTATKSAADPESLTEDIEEWPSLPEAPPPISGYRDSDIQGIACWNCGHFTIVGDPDNDGDLDGICELFEAQAEATMVCDRFVAHADLNRQGPHTSWTEDQADASRAKASMGEVNYSEQAVMNTINFSSVEASEEDGLIWKDILRTGEWDKTPTKNGVIEKKLQIIRDGESDPINGVISLAELETNFNEGAVPYVTVPLSDDDEDHKNIARVNTGYVRKLKIVDRDGMSFLQAGIDFTEPDVKEKVLRKTIPDVSAGIPFGVTRRSDKKFFRTVLDHVCLTRRPFIDKLMPFGIAAADSQELPVETWEQEANSSSPVPTPPVPVGEGSPPSSSENALSFRQQQGAIRNALTNQLRLGPDYIIEDIVGAQAVISHRTSQARWEVPFRITGEEANPVMVASVDKWKLIEEPKSEPEPIAASQKSELEKARELRELRLSQPTSQTGGIHMSVLKLDGVELSDLPEETRASIQAIIEKNAKLERSNRESDVDKRIEELKSLGFSDRPGALKFYRQVMLEDDGGPAVVLFSDAPESERQRKTATEILDGFIDALKAGDTVQFSDQHLASGNDNPPPKDASGEKADIETRVAEASKALYGDKTKRRTGRK
jgi:hypothetical protein